MRDIVVDKTSSRIWARVDTVNSLRMPAMSLAVEVHTVLFKGRKAGLSIARFVQEKGAKSSFVRIVDELKRTCEGKGTLVLDSNMVEEVRRGVGF